MQTVKDHIPMHPAVIWNSTAVPSLTENHNFPFHLKHQWILGAGSHFRSSRGGVVTRQFLYSQFYPKCCWNLHINVVLQLHVSWELSKIHFIDKIVDWI
jgi:hypothetical protein